MDIVIALAICQYVHIVCIKFMYGTSIPTCNCSVAPQNDVFNHAIRTLSCVKLHKLHIHIIICE